MLGIRNCPKRESRLMVFVEEDIKGEIEGDVIDLVKEDDSGRGEFATEEILDEEAEDEDDTEGICREVECDIVDKEGADGDFTIGVEPILLLLICFFRLLFLVL